MATYWEHPEEEDTIGVLLAWCEKNRGKTFNIVYEGGEEYKCKFCTSYDADNENAIDEGTETEPVEYCALAVDPVEDICPGPHHDEPGTLIELSFRDFPNQITAEDGTVIYNNSL